jgi:4-hydroxythreonine-4-phosphate dehydrogenase
VVAVARTGSSGARRRPPPAIGLTMGDPAGIGPEVVVKALADDRTRRRARFIVIGDEATLEAARRRFAPRLRFAACQPASPFPAAAAARVVGLVVPRGQRRLAVEPGRVTAAAGAAALRAIRTAADLALAGEIDAIVTAPVHKRALRLAGERRIGHTEILAARTGRPDAVFLMLVHGRLRVTHVTCHQPIAVAVAGIDAARVLAAIRLTHEALARLGLPAPRIGVAGLNPHAGEGGILGREERLAIEPAIRAACREGLAVTGPYPPDVLFPRLVSGDLDAVVAQYHDQGHIPFKLLTFRHRSGRPGMAHVRGVNVSLGLPFVRTSVDHGAALDIAGRGLADPASMREAIDLACRLLQRPGRLGYNAPRS